MRGKYRMDILLQTNAFPFVSAFKDFVFLLFQALLMLSKFPSDIVGNQMETYRFHDAVNILLSLQVWNHTIYLLHTMVYAVERDTCPLKQYKKRQIQSQQYLLLSIEPRAHACLQDISGKNKHQFLSFSTCASIGVELTNSILVHATAITVMFQIYTNVKHSKE